MENHFAGKPKKTPRGVFRSRVTCVELDNTERSQNPSFPIFVVDVGNALGKQKN
jgi:hypothetical protein